MTLTSTPEAERLIALCYSYAPPDVGTRYLTETERHFRLLSAGLRTSEEARVKAERERDEHLADACEAETALADMRRERDASDAALIEAAEECVMPESLSDEALAAITAARSRAKPDGEEKKL